MPETDIERIIVGREGRGYSLRMPEYTYERLSQYAKGRGQSINLVVNRAIEEFLDKEDTVDEQDNDI